MSHEGNPGGYSAEGAGASRDAQQKAAQKRMQQNQAQVEEVVGIMRVNVEKVLERDEKLSELDDLADELQKGASQFEQQASKLKMRNWWANLKMMIILGVVIVALTTIFLIIEYSGEDRSSIPMNPVEPTNSVAALSTAAPPPPESAALVAPN